MQEEDWGKYSQAPWMTGETWQDTNTSKRSNEERKARKSAQGLTNEHACDFSSKDKSSQEEDRFRTEVDLADLKIKLRRWNFARSWGSASSSLVGDESRISPRSRPEDIEEDSTCTNKAPLFADLPEKNETGHGDLAALSCHRVYTIAKPNPPLDRNTIGQYLDQCIAATESQLAGARNKSQKKKAVREIERLVAKVVTQAGLVRES
ncbi:MAG: hypothetical protein ASARMPREDX12_009160 [Alectoria sarmentosa]|nr:MAG: hypothetical protein ASARMPREDX12_009160 [Alectoria sarmentosa]